MWRVISATLFLLLALSSMQAQMRGSRGGATAFRGGSPVRVGAPRSSVVVRSQVRGSHFGFGFGFGFGPHFPRRFFYPRVYPYVYGYPYGYPYYGAYVYDPGYYGSYYSANNYDANAAQQQQLNAEVSSLNQQMQQLRQENDDLREYVTRTDKYSRSPAPQPDRSIPQSLQEPASPPTPATVLVFRDGHRIETRNYALVGNTLWILSEKRSEKVPIADLDLARTQQENEQRGVEFTAPAHD